MRALRGFLTAGLLAGTLDGCLFDERILTPSQPRIAVHAMLNPSATSIRVLVEEIRVGQEEGPSSGVIAGVGGFPVSNARVVIYDAAGDSAIGVEDEFQVGNSGVYWFRVGAWASAPNRLSIRPGVRYRLRITASGKPTVRATTLVPDATWLGHEMCCRTFNVDRDSLRLEWPGARGAKGYAVWIRSQNEDYRIFADGERISLSAGRRTSTFDREGDPFLPGTTQDVMVAALDTNYVDYYRSQTNPLTGTGLISRVEGGTGVFGSNVEILRLRVRTQSSQQEPIEGLFERVDDDPVDAPRWIDLYRAPREGRGPLRLFGWYGNDSTVRDGDIATYSSPGNDKIVNFGYGFGGTGFSGWLTAPDTVVGRVSGCGGFVSGNVVYVKRRAISGPSGAGLTSRRESPGRAGTAQLRETPRDMVMSFC